MLNNHLICRYLLLLGIPLILLLWKNLDPLKSCSFMLYSLSTSSPSQIPSTKNSLQMQNETLNITEFRLVTAFYADHFDEALRNCKIIGDLDETQNWMWGYMIAYVLKDDLSREQFDQYRYECSFVTLRKFNASKNPDFVSRNLYEYRWKPLIIDEVMQEVEKVFWIDSSVVFKDGANESISDIVAKMDTTYVKCGLRVFGDAGHSILYATHPKMLQYYNVSEDTARKNAMLAATYFIISKRYGMDILEKWKNCALEKECMAPEGHQLFCTCLECLEKNTYAGCHRFDQSALSILAYKCSSNLSDFCESSPLLDVKRM